MTPTTSTSAGAPTTGAAPSSQAIDPRLLEASGAEAHAPRGRSPGFTRRGKRTREWLHLKKVELLRAGSISEAQAEREAARALDQLYTQPGAREVLRQFEKTAPSSACPRRDELYRDVEIAATLWHPVMRWLEALLTRRTGLRGPAGSRSLVASVFLRMALGRGTPEIKATREGLLVGRPLENWAHDYPDQGPSYKGFCKSLRKMLAAAPADATLHANLELFRQLAEQRDERGRLAHPDAGRIGIADATSIEADVEQRSPKGATSSRERDTHAQILRGPGRELANDVVYTDGNGSVRSFWVGYRLLVISDLATGLPLVWKLLPATGNERDGTLALLRALFELWPQCPLDTLVGDALYDGEKAFAYELVFRWGIQPCFPKHGEYAQDLPHVATDGVPTCACGDLMKLKDVDPGLTAASRERAGVKRGERSPHTDARIRWVCRHARAGCKGAATRPRDDARLYTFLPRAGDHQRAYLRQALLLRRNAVECLFASLKHLGLGGTGTQRPKWARDEEMVWLLSCGLLNMTAKRLAHESGRYSEALAEADGLGLLDQPSEALPAPGPDEAQLRGVREARWARLGEARAPRSWGDGASPQRETASATARDASPPQVQATVAALRDTRCCTTSTFER